MSATLAVSVPIEVMAMAGLGARMVAARPVGFDVQGSAAPCIDMVRAATVEALGDEPADLAYRVGLCSGPPREA
jgi:hypothetical protein